MIDAGVGLPSGWPIRRLRAPLVAVPEARVNPSLELGVDAEDSRRVAAEVEESQGPGHPTGWQPPGAARRVEQGPDHGSAETEADDPEIGAGDPARELLEPGRHVADEALGGRATSPPARCRTRARRSRPPRRRGRPPGGYPSAARRPATDRMWSVRPRFSWMTSMAPAGVPAAARNPCSSPPRAGESDGLQPGMEVAEAPDAAARNRKRSAGADDPSAGRDAAGLGRVLRLRRPPARPTPMRPSSPAGSTAGPPRAG